MRSNYRRLGDYIREFSEKNNSNKIDKLLGVSNEKYFIPSIANINGTDLSKYKTIKHGQFAYGPVTSRNGDKISIALLEEDEAIVSTSYITFEIINREELLPEYLMLWFKRPEFDRYARFMSHGSVREIFDWEKMSNVKLPIPDIVKQEEIVHLARLLENSISRSKRISNLINSILVNRFLAMFPEFTLDEKLNQGIFRSVTINELINLFNGYAFKSDKYDENGNYSVITIGNVQNDLLDLEKVNKIIKIPKNMPINCKLIEKDLLMSLTGNIGRTCFVIGEHHLLNQRVCKIVPKINENMAFVLSLLNTDEMLNKLNSISGGTAQQNLSTRVFEAINLYNIDTGKIKTFANMNKLLNYKFYSLKSYYKSIELKKQIIPELLINV